MAEFPAARPPMEKRQRREDDDAEASKRPRREIRTVGFLGISDYGLGQLRILADRYRVSFASCKAKRSGHAEGLTGQLEELCLQKGIEFIGAVDVNSADVVERMRSTDVVIIGGYDRILKQRAIEAPRYGVLNTHLGLLPLNRGCCPTMWAQLHGLPQGFTTYQVNTAVDHGEILDYFEADARLGGLADTNRQVYDSLAEQAIVRFEDSLLRFERGEALASCSGREAYHRQGMPNDGWLSWHWSSPFLRRFSLALDFAPYLPGRCQVQGRKEPISVAVEAKIEDDTSDLPQGWANRRIGEVIRAEEGTRTFVVRAREGAMLCQVRDGRPPTVGDILVCPDTCDGRHAIDPHFAGDVLPLARYEIAHEKSGSH